ncbi:hypothetical protein PT974_05649 [Cladobotryum mycophilum]|uniref:Dienelactone hydrolase domain-containing protein n=1 Tax=Cladobotryum mycophilum TaxID=491253 RepID=A0ABR0SJF0_9HYPO
MSQPTKVHFPSSQLTICGELYAPEGDHDRKGAAVVISHPWTGVKEQTASDYARTLSKAGFYALTFDAGYQGESTGEPRGLEDPHQRVEDIKSAVTYLTTLEGRVDANKIGLVGICASGGFASYAAQSDSRIKVIATVSAVCIGRMTRNGGVHEHSKETPEAISGALQAAGQWRNGHANNKPSPLSETPAVFELDPAKIPIDADPFLKDASEYYGTKRGKHERCTHRVPPHSFDLIVSYDSFNFQHLISPRPLLMIAGSEAQTLHYSKWAIDQAKEPKELFVVQGKNHFDLYDDVSESGPKIVEFLGKALV